MLLSSFERRIYSQHGEDGIIERLFALLGTKRKVFVELSAGDGLECNTRALRARDWSGLAVGKGPGLVDAWVTAENAADLLAEHGTPTDFDFLALDLDGVDYWVLRALLVAGYRPRVLCVEYNAALGPEARLSIPYDPEFRWDHRTTFYGASLAAFSDLLEPRGYTLLGCESRGVNAFFVQTELWRSAKWMPFGYDPPFEATTRAFVEVP